MGKKLFKKTTRKRFINQLQADDTLTLITTVTRECVLGCLYCYARDPGKKEANQIIGYDILEKIIHDAFDVRQKNIIFEFTGGEALLGGIPFYKKVIEYQKKHERNGKKYHSCIQTSGALYDESLYDFLIDNKITLSLTIDGPRDLHNLQRPKGCGGGSFDTVLKSYHYIKKRQGWCGVLCTITKNSLHRVGEIVDFYRKMGICGWFTNPYFFDPSKAVKNDTIGLTNDDFAKYFIDQFEHILKIDDASLHPDFIISNTKRLCGLHSGFKCSQGGKCLSNITNIDNKGNVFLCCRFLGNDSAAYGNIMDKPLCYLLSMENPVMRRVVNDRVKALNRCEGKKCIYLPLCNAGCPHESYLTSHGRNFSATESLCEGKYKIFSHMDKRLKEFGLATITDIFKKTKGGEYGDEKSGSLCEQPPRYSKREGDRRRGKDAEYDRSSCRPSEGRKRLKNPGRGIDLSQQE